MSKYIGVAQSAFLARVTLGGWEGFVKQALLPFHSFDYRRSPYFRNVRARAFACDSISLVVIVIARFIFPSTSAI